MGNRSEEHEGQKRSKARRKKKLNGKSKFFPIIILNVVQNAHRIPALR